jgi:hypothetical protein
MFEHVKVLVHRAIMEFTLFGIGGAILTLIGLTGLLMMGPAGQRRFSKLDPLAYQRETLAVKR